MSKISPWVFAQIQKVKNENKQLLHRNSVLEAKLDQLQKTLSLKKYEDVDQPPHKQTTLTNPSDQSENIQKLNEEIKTLRHLLDQSEEMRTQQMEFIRKIRNSCERFTWSNQAAADSFEESVALYMKGSHQGEADSRESELPKRSQLGYRKQLDTIEERVSKRPRIQGPQESILQDFPKQEIHKKRGPKGPRKKKPQQQESTEEVTKVFNVFRDKEDVQKYFNNQEDQPIEGQKIKRKPGRPSKKEMQRRVQEQQKAIKRGKELKQRMIKKLKESIKSEEEQKMENQQSQGQQSGQDQQFEEQKEKEKSGREEDSNEVEVQLIDQEEEEHNTTFQEGNEDNSQKEIELDVEEKS